jgi:glycosyltransferase involved in cell wall biosynthesis
VSAHGPDVSIVIPCYRGEKFIRDAIASVLSQEGGRVEVVVVDDGSPDHSAAVIEAIADSRVRLVRHQRNHGIATARNTGLEASRAGLVAFLDQDDLWLPGRLGDQLRAFEADASGDVALVFGITIVIDRLGRTKSSPHRVPHDLPTLRGKQLLERLIVDNPIPLGAAMIRRRYLDAVGPFDESIRGGSDDFDMIVRLAEHGRFGFLERQCFARRLHDDNYTRADRMTEESLGVIDRVERRYPDLAHAARVGRSRKLYRRARYMQLAGDAKRAVPDYHAAIAAWPWQARAWIGLALCHLGPVGQMFSDWWNRGRNAT